MRFGRFFVFRRSPHHHAAADIHAGLFAAGSRSTGCDRLRPRRRSDSSAPGTCPPRPSWPARGRPWATCAPAPSANRSCTRSRLRRSSLRRPLNSFWRALRSADSESENSLEGRHERLDIVGRRSLRRLEALHRVGKVPEQAAREAGLLRRHFVHGRHRHGTSCQKHGGRRHHQGGRDPATSSVRNADDVRCESVDTNTERARKALKYSNPDRRIIASRSHSSPRQRHPQYRQQQAPGQHRRKAEVPSVTSDPAILAGNIGGARNGLWQTSVAACLVPFRRRSHRSPTESQRATAPPER